MRHYKIIGSFGINRVSISVGQIENLTLATLFSNQNISIKNNPEESSKNEHVVKYLKIRYPDTGEYAL